MYSNDKILTQHFLLILEERNEDGTRGNNPDQNTTNQVKEFYETNDNHNLQRFTLYTMTLTQF